MFEFAFATVGDLEDMGEGVDLPLVGTFEFTQILD
jgi:hypothetical protein